MLLNQLRQIVHRYEELGITIAQPEVIADINRWRELMREHAQLGPIVEKTQQLEGMVKQLDEAEEIIQQGGLGDEDMLALALEEKTELQKAIPELEQEIRILMLPVDENDDKNVVLEVRAGAGGEEAALFGMNLLRMYMRYAERKGWKAELTDLNETEIGGAKEAVLLINGKGAYSRLKYESGAHRVQRVPETESSGRIHTSAATVVVLPEAEDVDVEVNNTDLRIDTYRAGGAGGQYVNKTESAVRITHMPTGLVVTCQDEKSQSKNREKAMRVLKSRLYDFYKSQADAQQSDARRSLVGTGDRSDRIRTYNFPQARVTDHRINLTIYQLESFLDGDMDQMLDALITYDQAQRLQAAEGGHTGM